MVWVLSTDCYLNPAVPRFRYSVRGRNQGITLAMISYLNVLPIYALGNNNFRYDFGAQKGKMAIVIDGSDRVGVATDDNIRRFPVPDYIFDFVQ